MKVIKKENYKVPVFSWCPEIEDSAMKQIDNMAQLPFLHKRICIMPDAHLGLGCVIGSVIATKNVIIPAAVSSDIGCGLVAVKTSLTDIDTETLKKIMGEIRKVIPVGFSKQPEKQDRKLLPETFGERIIQQELNNARKSLGSLGGGNHFISIEKGSDRHIWIMIHSGSRNLGKQVADYYNKLAIKLNEKWHSKVPKEWELAFLPVDSEEGQAYIREMNYCVEFAFANRKLMMDKIKKIFVKETDCIFCFKSDNVIFDDNNMLNIAHNYASQENHFGKNVWVHRKGATQAKKGQIGIIPGSQGTSSYIVEGLGNPESFESCSHGAGRVMGRKQAKKELNLEKEIKILNDQNIIHGIRNQDDLDESVSCYKNIEYIISQQTDLIKPIVKLTPLAVIKG